jgi:hypothetical protein
LLTAVFIAMLVLVAPAAAAPDPPYACKLPVIRWVEPVVPVNAAAPVHHNLGGMIGASELLTAALRQACCSAPGRST